MILDVATANPGTDSGYWLAVVALIISVFAVIFAGWQAHLQKRSTDLEQQQLDLHKIELNNEKKKEENYRSKTLSERIFSALVGALIDRVDHAISIYVTTPLDDTLGGTFYERTPVQDLPYFIAGETYLKDKFPDAYSDWSKVEELVNRYNLDAAAFMVELEELTKNKMKEVYPTLEAAGKVSIDQTNYYYVPNLAMTFHDLLISGGDLPGKTPADSHGRYWFRASSGFLLIADKEEYADDARLLGVYEAISKESKVTRYVETLKQTYAKAHIHLSDFEVKLRRIMENIDLQQPEEFRSVVGASE